jgi:hypothetical protein
VRTGSCSSLAGKEGEAAMEERNEDARVLWMKKIRLRGDSMRAVDRVERENKEIK